MHYAEKFATMPDGIKIYYRVYNITSSKTPLVCLPGLTRNSKDFHKFAIRRVENYNDKVIAIDMCGRGRSDYASDSNRYDLLSEVTDIIHIITECEKLTQVHFLGTSRGGMQTAIIAGIRPDLLGKVILNDIGVRIPMAVLGELAVLFQHSPIPIDSFEKALLIRRAYDKGTTKNLTPQQEVDVIFSTYKVIDGLYVGDYDRAGMGEAFVKNADYLKTLNPDFVDLSVIFSNLENIPTLLLHGENSTLTTQAIADDTMSMLKKGVYKRIKDRGHVPLLTEPDTIEAIDRFLD